MELFHRIHSCTLILSFKNKKHVIMSLFICMLNILFVTTSCSKNDMDLIDISKIDFTINSVKELVDDSLKINVSIENKSGIDFYLLNKQEVSMSNNPAFVWNLEIYYSDSILMISPVNFFDKLSKPTDMDYYYMKNGGKYTFSFKVDFNKLVRTPSDFGSINDDFGEYSLKLTYKDPFCIVKNALNEQIESNVIKVIYKKE